MYIETVPNRNSPPAVLLRESFRENGKVKKRTLLNLSHWPKHIVAGLKALLKGGTVVPAGPQPFTITRSLPHGHAAAAQLHRNTARRCRLQASSNHTRAA